VTPIAEMSLAELAAARAGPLSLDELVEGARRRGVLRLRQQAWHRLTRAPGSFWKSVVALIAAREGDAHRSRAAVDAEREP